MKVENSKLKILIATGIYEPDIGGPASYARVIARAFSGEHHVTMITYSSPWSHNADNDKPFRIIRVWRLWPKGIKHLIYFCRLWFLAGKCDVVFALNAVSAGVPAMWAARLRKKELFVKIVGDYAWEIAVQAGRTALLINDFQKEKKRGWIGFLHRQQVKVCRAANYVIVPSQYLSDIVSGWGVPDEKIRVVYNGVDPVPLETTKEEARKKIGISGNLIVSIGRLVPWKGFRMLIKIMPELLKINQFFRLVIAGDGPDTPILKTMVRNLGLGRKVFIVGRKSADELKYFLAAADIFLLNSGYEGFSHQVLEAMAAGVPVITTAVGGNREIIRQGENGFLVRYNDEFNLIEGIKTLWQIPELRNEFIKEGRSTAAKFTSASMVAQTSEILFSHG